MPASSLVDFSPALRLALLPHNPQKLNAGHDLLRDLLQPGA